MISSPIDRLKRYYDGVQQGVSGNSRHDCSGVSHKTEVVEERNKSVDLRYASFSQSCGRMRNLKEVNCRGISLARVCFAY